MKDRKNEIIEMPAILKKNSYEGYTQSGEKLITIRNCKKDSFDYAINLAIAYIHDPLNLLYYDTGSIKIKKTNCFACRFCLCDAEGRSCQLGADKYSEACKLFEEA